jgi:NhaP-type Na+/H+ or K+/H+ antiporter
MSGLKLKSSDEEESEKAVYIAYILLLSIMVVYVTAGTWMERRKCAFGHETGIVILLGIAIGAILELCGDDIVSTEFNPVVLFDFGLPFILYAAGYNMRRRRFFDDINNITMFGVLSTVVCFVLLSVTTICIFNWGWVYKFEEKQSDGSWTHSQVNMPAIEISLLCAMLCSSDIIAAVSLVKYKEYPKIFSILLGEGLWNDAVAVVLA